MRGLQVNKVGTGEKEWHWFEVFVKCLLVWAYGDVAGLSSVYVYVGWLRRSGCSGLEQARGSGILMCWAYMYVKVVWLSVQYSMVCVMGYVGCVGLAGIGRSKSGISGFVYISVFPVSVVQYEELAVGYVCVMGIDVVMSVGQVVMLVAKC